MYILDSVPAFNRSIFLRCDHISRPATAKAKRMKLIAKVLRGITLFAGTVGALVYLLLCQPEVMDISFNWIALAIDAAAMIVLFIVAGCIGASAKTHDQIADEIEAEYMVEQALLAEQERDELLSLETLQAVAEAYAIELIQKQLQSSPQYIQLQMVEKWNGEWPQVMGDTVNPFVSLNTTD